MSRRYGRNQKRKHKEALKNAQAEADKYKKLYTDRDIYEVTLRNTLQHIFNMFKDVISKYSIIFPITTIEGTEIIEATRRIEIINALCAIEQVAYSYRTPIDNYTQRKVLYALETIVSSTKRGEIHPKEALCVQVNYKDNMQYYLSEDALLCLNDEAIIKFCIGTIIPQLVEQLKARQERLRS